MKVVQVRKRPAVEDRDRTAAELITLSDEDLITVDQLAALMRLSVPTVRAYMQRGLFRPERWGPSGKHLFLLGDCKMRIKQFQQLRRAGYSVSLAIRAMEEG